MVVHRAKVVALLAALMLAGGCAAQDPAAPGGSTSAPTDVASPTPPSVPTPPTATRTPDPLPTYRPSPRPKATITLPGEPSKPAAGAMELTGRVTAGVEGGGCLLLDGYLLINPNPRIVREGATIRVTGRIRMDMMTTCQQGTPFEIETAEPA